MLKLKADFGADWIELLRSDLVNAQGWPAGEVAALDDKDVQFRYWESKRRRITATPRTIRVADDFACPPEHEAGWKALQQKVLSGDDINHHLSKDHRSLLNADGLLAEWGVHHFHLGVKPDTQDSAYIERTGPLLYALVDAQTFCAINVFDHHSFEDECVLEGIHRNWPELISRYRVRGVTGHKNLAPVQRRSLRKNNIDVFTSTSDGTVYLPTTGGVMTAGVNSEAVRIADYWHDRITRIQANFGESPEVLMALRKNGFSDEEEAEAKLTQVSKSGVQVYFPKYRVLVNVAINFEAVHE